MTLRTDLTTTSANVASLSSNISSISSNLVSIQSNLNTTTSNTVTLRTDLTTTSANVASLRTSNITLVTSNIISNGSENNYLWNTVANFSNAFIFSNAGAGSNLFIGNQVTGEVVIQGIISDIGTTALSNNSVFIGTLGQTTMNIRGGTLNFVNLAPNVSSITTTTSFVKGFPMTAVIALSAETGAISASPTVPAAWFRIPYPWLIEGVRGYVYTPSSSGTITIDIRSVASGTAIPTISSGGTSIFSTALTIDATRPSSVSSAVSAVITNAAGTVGLADDTGLAFFVTGAGTGAAVLKVVIYYTMF